MSANKLLGGLSFVSRTFEGTFKETPFVLDMDANLYIGPADQLCRDEHSAVEVVFNYLRELEKADRPVKDLLRNRLALLEVFDAFDCARQEDGDSEETEFRIFVFGSYDGVILDAIADDDMPAGPCGKTVNEIKNRLYQLCLRSDSQFQSRTLSPKHIEIEQRFLPKT